MSAYSHEAIFFAPRSSLILWGVFVGARACESWCFGFRPRVFARAGDQTALDNTTETCAGKCMKAFVFSAMCVPTPTRHAPERLSANIARNSTWIICSYFDQRVGSGENYEGPKKWSAQQVVGARNKLRFDCFQLQCLLFYFFCCGAAQRHRGGWGERRKPDRRI